MTDYSELTEGQRDAVGGVLTQAERLYWADIDAGTVRLSNNPFLALAALAAYAHRLMRIHENGELPEKAVLTESTMRAMTELIATMPDWEPSPRWPFSKGEMEESLRAWG